MSDRGGSIRLAGKDDARQVRRVATGILGVLFAVFVATSLPADPPVWILLIRAMAEAGMVGGLADWFAVEALFRRPLRLPIPHTALLPANQERAATNIARFIDEYFLEPDQLIKQIRHVDPMSRVAAWLRQRQNAELAAQEFAWAINMLVQAQLKDGVPGPIRHMVMDTLQRAARSDSLSDQVAGLMKGVLDTKALDEILKHVRQAIDDNRPAIIELVHDRSRWWIASGVDRQVASVLVDGILSFLDELGDETSPRRQGLTNSVSNMFDRFRDDGVITRFFEDSLDDLASSQRFDTALDGLLTALLSEVRQRFGDKDTVLRDALTNSLQDIASFLEQNPGIRAEIEARLETALVTLLTALRSPVRSYITETIANWDSDELVSRIETEVGRDLQFIRVNGAVLGSVLGGILFAVGHFAL